MQVKVFSYYNRICGLDGCQEVHHRLLHQQVVNKNSAVNKKLIMIQEMYLQQTGCIADKGVPQQKKHVDVVISSKTTGLSSVGALQIIMRMLQ